MDPDVYIRTETLREDVQSRRVCTRSHRQEVLRTGNEVLEIAGADLCAPSFFPDYSSYLASGLYRLNIYVHNCTLLRAVAAPQARTNYLFLGLGIYVFSLWTSNQHL